MDKVIDELIQIALKHGYTVRGDGKPDAFHVWFTPLNHDCSDYEQGG